MKTLDAGKDKVKKICDLIRFETLEPAKKQAEEIIAEAKRQAEKIIEEAQNQSDKIIQDTREGIEKEKAVFQSSLTQSSRQSLEALRQDIEHTLFNDEIHNLIDKPLNDKDVVVKLIESVIKAIENEGITEDLSVAVAKSISAKEINNELTAKVIKRLKEKGVVVGDFSGGIKVKIHGKKMIVEVTEEALRELLAKYVRKDFRKVIFGC